MTQITINYHKYNNQFAQCIIELPTTNVAELQSHFQQFLGMEMTLGTFIKNVTFINKLIRFPKSKNSIFV